MKIRKSTIVHNFIMVIAMQIAKAEPLYVVKRNWDILIVLDACRYDYFEKVNWIPGRLQALEVESSCTIAWLKMNFPGKYDIVYISANPFCNSKRPVHGFLGRDHFKKVVDVWDFGWSNMLKTVPPDIVTATFVGEFEANPHERYIVHYMQPHGPYIGKVRLNIETWDKYGKTIRGMWEHPRPDLKLLREAYRSNLELVLKEVERLIKYVKSRGFRKKIVITADHGELLGEDGMFAHPCHIKHSCLNIVPWLEVQL